MLVLIIQGIDVECYVLIIQGIDVECYVLIIEGSIMSSVKELS